MFFSSDVIGQHVKIISFISSMSYHVGHRLGKPVASNILEKHGLIRVEGIINCRHCSKTNPLCKCTNRIFLTSDRTSATDARDLCPDSFSKCAGCLEELDSEGNKLCGTYDIKCRNLEKTMVTNKRAQKISRAWEIKKEYDQSTVEQIRLYTDTKKVDPRNIINLDSDESSTAEMEDDNKLPCFSGKSLSQFQNSPDAETTVCAPKKRKTHSHIGPKGYNNLASLRYNHTYTWVNTPRCMVCIHIHTGISAKCRCIIHLYTKCIDRGVFSLQKTIF